MGGEKTTTITSSPLVISMRGHFDPISGTLKTAHNETDYAFNKSVITDLQKKKRTVLMKLQLLFMDLA